MGRIMHTNPKHSGTVMIRPAVAGADTDALSGAAEAVVFTDGIAETSDAALLLGALLSGFDTSDGPGVKRDVGTMPHSSAVGTRLRDAAVDPQAGDVVPENAGDVHPHNPAAVWPIQGIDGR